MYDGDSFVLLAADGRRLQVRISGIDAPEKGQAFADRSRRHLSELLVQQDLLITPIKTDVYGRVVAVVSAGEQDIGLAQLRAGLAWHFLRYARDQSVEQRQAYARAEAAAREAGVGLWRDREPLEPWRFREKQRERKERRLEDRADARPTAIVRSDPLAARPRGRRRLGSATA